MPEERYHRRKAEISSWDQHKNARREKSLGSVSLESHGSQEGEELGECSRKRNCCGREKARWKKNRLRGTCALRKRGYKKRKP